MTRRICALCHDDNPDVRPGLVEWEDGGFDAILRCSDHAACRGRVILAGERWPVREEVPA